MIGAIRRAETANIEDYDGNFVAGASDDAGTPVAPPWMRTLAAVLAVEGWRWPVPPLHAVMASAAGVAQSGRRSRSALAAHDTGCRPRRGLRWIC